MNRLAIIVGKGNPKKVTGDEQGNVKKLHGIRLDWAKDDAGRWQMKEQPGSEFELDCDLCLLAMGFVGPQKEGLLEQLGVELNERGNVLGMMPHPENHVESVIGPTDGRGLFAGLTAHLSTAA